LTISEIFEYVGARFLGAHGMNVLRGDDLVGAQQQGCWIGRLERRRAMRTGKWNAFLSGLCGVAATLGAVAPSFADVTTEQGSSILIFPKVRATDNFDTIIQITNTGNSMVHAHCNYVNDLDGWNEVDFDIWLTKQQPTHWVVSEGRRLDPQCSQFGESCAGFNPGLIPPRPDFEGELKCVEVDESGAAYTGNHLVGVATLVATDTVTNESTEDDVTTYNAIGLRGNPDVRPSNPLLLDGEVYDACPSKLTLNFFATGAENDVVSVSNSLDTELTLVPCQQDFENIDPETVTIQFLVYNEFEQRFSNSTTVECFLNIELTDLDSFTTPDNSVFSFEVLGSKAAAAVFTPVTALDGTSGGLVGIAEHITQLGGGGASRSAFNLHSEGSYIPADGPDTIRLAEPF